MVRQNESTIVEPRGLVWVAEVVVAALVTMSLLPMLFLYVLDLAAGSIAPDAAWALGIAIGLLGIWVAVMTPDSLYQRSPAMRWAAVITLALATTLLAQLAWGSVRTAGMDFGILVELAAAGVALHQVVRLILLSKKS